MYKGDLGKKPVPPVLSFLIEAGVVALILAMHYSGSDPSGVGQPQTGQASNWRMPGHENGADRSYSGQVTILKLPVGKMTRWEWKKGKLGHADPDGMVKILTGSGKRWEDGPDLQGPVLDTVREPRDLIWYYLPIGDKPVTVTIIEG